MSNNAKTGQATVGRATTGRWITAVAVITGPIRGIANAIATIRGTKDAI